MPQKIISSIGFLWPTFFHGLSLYFFSVHSEDIISLRYVVIPVPHNVWTWQQVEFMRNKLHVLLVGMTTGLTIMVDACNAKSAKSYRFNSSQVCSLVRRYIVGAFRLRGYAGYKCWSAHVLIYFCNTFESHEVRHLQVHSYVRTLFGFTRQIGHSFRFRGIPHSSFTQFWNDERQQGKASPFHCRSTAPCKVSPGVAIGSAHVDI